jgi:branched-chain amino acid transport system substrate-binding protein
MKRILWLAPLALVLAAAQADAAEIKIGYVNTMTGPGAVVGNDVKKGVDLAVEHINKKMGALDVNVIYADDEQNPQKGKQAVEKLVERDNVDIVAGQIWSNVLLASKDVVLDAGKFLISANAGPSEMAGKQCHKNFFNISWQNDQTPMAMGELLNQRGVKSLYLIGPNYAAGQDMLKGVERTFKGKVAGKDLTTWPAQLDWSAELTKVKGANPDGVFVFFPGGHGPAFMTQYEQAGLSGKIPLYSVYTVDGVTLPLLQKGNIKSVLGTYLTQMWAVDSDNPVNKKFVADFKAKNGTYPSMYAAQAYDAIMLIKSGVEAVKGNLKDMDGMRKAFEAAKFDTVRGSIKMGPNHFPIQNFYANEVVQDKDGVWYNSQRQVVFKDHQDVYAQDCKM